MELTIRNLLNQLVWDPRENRAEYELTYVHRGEPDGIKTITCDMIQTVEASWFTYIDTEEEVLIPFHRIRKIKHLETQRILWKKGEEGKNNYRN